MEERPCVLKLSLASGYFAVEALLYIMFWCFGWFKFKGSSTELCIIV